MATDYIDVDLSEAEKAVVLKYAGFYVMDEITKADLSNKRRKWIRFKRNTVSDVIGELSYCFNRCKDDCMFHLLDETISHLEFYEQK